MNTKVTIIVPIYNVEKYVAKCLESLINQTFKEIEIYAIIDGSPDNSIDIVKEFCKKDNRIKCIEKENGGYGSALELAISTITSKYFLICDPDDWLSENAVEVLYNAAEKNDVDLVVGDKYLVFSDNEEQEYSCSVTPDMKIIPNKVYKDEEASILCNLSVSPHSKLFKTELAKNINFPKKVSYTDFLLYILYCDNIKSGIYLEKPLSYYLIDREGNTATDVSLKAVNNILTVFKSILEQLNNHSVNGKYIYYKMFCHYKIVIMTMASKLNSEEYKTVEEEIYNLLEELKKHKNEIKKYFPMKKIYNKFIFMLLINDITKRFTFNYLIKKYRKRNK